MYQAAVAVAVISEEIKEEKRINPLHGHDFGQQGHGSSKQDHPKPPFVWGQIGKLFLTEKPTQSLEVMPDGTSLIVVSWRKAPHGCGGVSNQYEVIDPFSN